MKKLTELLKFRKRTYTRLKTVILTEEHIKDLDRRDISRLRSIYIYDFYDNVKRLTSEVTILTDRKRLGKTSLMEFHKTQEIQLKNILFLTKVIVSKATKENKALRRIKEQEAITHE